MKFDKGGHNVCPLLSFCPHYCPLNIICNISMLYVFLIKMDKGTSIFHIFNICS